MITVTEQHKKKIEMYPKNKELRRAIKLTLIIFALIQLLNVIMGSEIYFGQKLLVNFVFTAMYTFSLYGVNYYLFIKLDAYFIDRFSIKRIIVGFVGSFIVSLAVIFLMHVFEEVLYNKKPFQDFMANEKPIN